MSVPVAVVNTALKTANGASISTGIWTLVVVTIGGIIAAIIKQRGPWRKTEIEREANLLNERAEEMEAMRTRIAKLEEKAEYKDALHQAERAIDRHRINNLDQCLTAFLMMVKKNPDDAATAAAMIEEMRGQQIEREKQEASAIHAAVITASKTGA